jgi:predicted RNase H-like HicB family nuclease
MSRKRKRNSHRPAPAVLPTVKDVGEAMAEASTFEEVMAATSLALQLAVEDRPKAVKYAFALMREQGELHLDLGQIKQIVVDAGRQWPE